MNIPVFQSDEAATHHPDGRPRLFEVVRAPDGSVAKLLVHPSRWDEYVAAITAPRDARHPDVVALFELVRIQAS